MATYWFPHFRSSALETKNVTALCLPLYSRLNKCANFYFLLNLMSIKIVGAQKPTSVFLSGFPFNQPLDPRRRARKLPRAPNPLEPRPGIVHGHGPGQVQGRVCGHPVLAPQEPPSKRGRRFVCSQNTFQTMDRVRQPDME